MKPICFTFLLFFLTASIIEAQNTYVPNDIFEQHLINLGLDNLLDNYVLTASISGLKSLDVSYKGINDLTGIQDFVSLQILHCENNSIPVLNIGGATALTQLYCANNQLTSLDVTNSTALTWLDCNANNISSLDVSHNTALTFLGCHGNNIDTLEVSQNTALTTLYCGHNDLTSLEVSGADALSILSCESNNLFSLDLTQNSALKTIYCTYNQLLVINVQNGNNSLITTFNASHNPFLSCIGVDDPVKANNGESPYTYWIKDNTATYSAGCILPRTYVPDDNFERVLGEMGYDDIAGDDSVTTYFLSVLEILDVAGEGIEDMTGIEDFINLSQLNCSNNQLSYLDLSKNSLLTVLNCSTNLLTGLNVRNGSNHLLTTFDASNNPSLECIEVDNELNAINLIAPYDAWIKDATAGYSGNCSLYGKKTYVPDDHFEQALVNLGYDTFPLDDSVSASLISRVTFLNVASKYIQDLTGIEGFTDLQTLNCYNNYLQSLDLSKNSALLSLSCYTNQLSELDLSGNTSLITLNITNNLLEGSFDLSDCPELRSLDCQNNQLTGLNLSGNPKLETLICRNNMITSLDLSGKDGLKSLDCFNNQLTELDVTNKPLMTILDCGFNQISELLLSGSGLQNIKCGFNQLSGLDVTEFSNLRQLDCRNNQLTSLDVSTNSKLWFLDCSNNLLEVLDLTGTTGLVDFVCSNNQLTELDVSNSPLLGGLYCSNNKIGSLGLTNNPALLTLHCHHNNLTGLYLVANTRLKYVWANDNVLLIGFDGPTVKGAKSGEASLANTSLRTLNLRNTGLESINVLDLGILDSLNMAGTQLNSLDVSGNPLLKYLNTTGTPLTCIQVSQDQLNNIPAAWVKDPTTIYSLDCQAVSIDDNNILSESIRLYPNPAKDILTIESDIRIFNVEIYSITGYLVKNIFSGFSAIPVNELAEGTYIIKVESAGGIVTKKFTVRH